MENQGFKYTDQIKKKDEGITVLGYYQKYYPLAFEEWPERLKNKQISLNSNIANEDGQQSLKAKDLLTYYRLPWIEPSINPHNPLLKHENGLLFFSKNGTLPVLPNGLFLEHSLLHIVHQQFPQAIPLHRLGRGTTGVIVFAENEIAAKKWSSEFQKRSVTKEYYTIISGTPSWETESVSCPLGIIPYEGCKDGLWAVQPLTGKESTSHFRILKKTSEWSLAHVRIETGRPHQIRIHAAFLGFPLWGDPLYGPGGNPKMEKIFDDSIQEWRLPIPGDIGYLLHSFRIHIGDLRVEIDPPLETWKNFIGDQKENYFTDHK